MRPTQKRKKEGRELGRRERKREEAYSEEKGRDRRPTEKRKKEGRELDRGVRRPKRTECLP